MNRSVLIISTGRTGTKFIANLLNRHLSDACVYHASPYTPMINILCNAHLAGYLPRNAVEYTWGIFKKKELSTCHKGIYIDSNNHLYALPLISPNLYPGLKVIHIIRDPRSYVPSHINWMKHRPKSYFAHHFVPFWQPNGFLMGEFTAKNWLKASTFERFCWIWDYKNAVIKKIQDTDIDYLSIRFEDIFLSNDGTKNINKLLAFAGLPPALTSINELQTRENQAKERTFPEWIKWTNELSAQMDKICGKRMLEYGYGTELEWRNKIAHTRQE